MTFRGHCILKLSLYFPDELTQIIADYATLSGHERLEQFFRCGNPVMIWSIPVNIWGPSNSPHSLRLDDTHNGIKVTSSLVPDQWEYLDWEYFITAATDHNLELDIDDELVPYTSACEIFDRLLEDLYSHWDSL